MRRLLSLAALCMLGFAMHASADEIPTEYKSARHLGMGGAGAAGAEGHDAIFYNPAGIGEVKGILNEVDALAPTAIVSSNTRNIYLDVQSKKTSAGTGVQGMIDAAQAYVNKPQGAEIENFSGVVFRRSAFGVLMSGKSNAVVQNNDYSLGLPTASFSETLRTGLYTSFARGFFNESLQLGLNYKYLIKEEAVISGSVIDLQNNKEALSGGVKCGDFFKCGTASGVDFGAIWKSDDMSISKPRLGVMVHNIGNTTYTAMSSGTTAPSADKQTIDVSVGIEPQTKKSGAKLYFDVDDVANKYQQEIYKRLHMGGEIAFAGVLGVMGGIGQGYPSYGAFLDARFVRIEGGIYTEEIGNYAGKMGDKRYFGRMILGWVQ